MFYDDLDQAQRAEWAKKDKEKKERTKVYLIIFKFVRLFVLKENSQN